MKRALSGLTILGIIVSCNDIPANTIEYKQNLINEKQCQYNLDSKDLHDRLYNAITYNILYKSIVEQKNQPTSCSFSVHQKFDEHLYGMMQLLWDDGTFVQYETMPIESSVFKVLVTPNMGKASEVRSNLLAHLHKIGLEINLPENQWNSFLNSGSDMTFESNETGVNGLVKVDVTPDGNILKLEISLSL